MKNLSSSFFKFFLITLLILGCCCIYVADASVYNDQLSHGDKNKPKESKLDSCESLSPSPSSSPFSPPSPSSLPSSSSTLIDTNVLDYGAIGDGNTDDSDVIFKLY